MKYCFFVNSAPFLMEFFGKLAHEAVRRGDPCLIVFTSKFAEYEKKQYFPEQAQFISKVDWCAAHYSSLKREFRDISWRELYPSFERVGRFPFGFAETQEWIIQEHQFLEYLFEQERPDAVLFEPASGLLSEMAYSLSSRYGIPYLGIMVSRSSDGRTDVYDLEWTCSKYEATFNRLGAQDVTNQEKELAKAYLEQFVKHTFTPLYVGLPKITFSPFGLIAHYIRRIRQKGGILIFYMLERMHFPHPDFESEIIIRHAMRAPFMVLRRQIRILLQRYIYRFLNEQDEFYLYPLHVSSESSTVVFARHFSDQLNSIKQIAFTLPFPSKLYVKEHPNAVGTRSMEFYNDLMRIPNVVLISPYENMHRLIEKTSGVVVLTSTVGMEAAFVGKPVYVLGNVFYSYHPMCRKVQGFAELHKRIQQDIGRAQEVSASDLEQMNARFFASYARNTIPGNLLLASLGNDVNDYKEIYESIGAIIREKKK